MLVHRAPELTGRGLSSSFITSAQLSTQSFSLHNPVRPTPTRRQEVLPISLNTYHMLTSN